MTPRRVGNGEVDRLVPWCAKCGHEVDCFSHLGNNPVTDVEGFIAECHGETQMVSIDSFLLACGAISSGVAFADGLLPWQIDMLIWTRDLELRSLSPGSRLRRASAPHVPPATLSRRS